MNLEQIILWLSDLIYYLTLLFEQMKNWTV